MKEKFVSKFSLLFLATAFATTSFADSSSCVTQANSNFEKLESCLTLDNLVKHLKVFQQNAETNRTIPGTRFMGTPGYETSRQYIVDELKAAGYNVTLQPVPVTLTYIKKPRVFEQISPIQKTFTDDTDYAPFVGSGEGEVIGDVQSLTNSGCNSSDFANFAKGNIALLSLSGECFTSEKVTNAVAAGAKAVIVANNSPGIYYIGFTPTPAENVPSLFVSAEVGKMLSDANKTGPLPKVHIKFDAIQMKTQSENIIAESKGGDANHVVMVGAHLDSSAGNAGINDNGSAVATVLEVALLMQKVEPVNKLRFAFWTGEEIGLIGSSYYVNHLNNDEKNKIALYLNYEILGAPNGARLIMGAKAGVTPAGSEKIMQTYANYFTQKGLKHLIFDPQMGNAGRRSDMLGFMQAGIPVGYLVSGADIPWNSILSSVFTDLPHRKRGVAMHPCYHKLCDNLTMADGEMRDPNFDFDLYLQMSKAAAFAIHSYAMNVGE